MGLFEKLKQKARQLKSESQVLMIAYKDKRTPASAKILIGVTTIRSSIKDQLDICYHNYYNLAYGFVFGSHGRKALTEIVQSQPRLSVQNL